jgi:purine-binding chemotaxis protein CheW
MNASTANHQSERRYCTFFLGDERYGIDILTVREINRQVQITPARGAPSAVRGLMNLRGQIVTVIDPAVRLGYPTREQKKTTRLVILKTNADLAALGHTTLSTHDELAGLWVDRISDVITVSEDQIAPAPPDQSGKNDHLLAAVVQLKDLVIRLVDPSALLRLGDVG